MSISKMTEVYTVFWKVHFFGKLRSAVGLEIRDDFPSP